jgi:hypothetical protein
MAASPGDIGAIQFDADGYSLIPTSCATTRCIDVGTYSSAPGLGTFTLKSSKTGNERTMTLTVLETSSPNVATAPVSVGGEALEPLADLVQSGQKLTNPRPKPLIQCIVSALIDGQKVVSDPSSKDGCPGSGTANGAGATPPTPPPNSDWADVCRFVWGGC